ncbi:MAG: 50S ribosomal protein L4 [Anaerolineae bacterium]|jgi:large subunit ribosomal protein L4|nr:50S ribosomal protein L4 [Chloroflexota bacterium]
MRVPVVNMAGETVDEIELNDSVFGIEPSAAVMHQALLRQLANARLGTASTKTRSEVAGGGRKPWRQKGTGRARQGSIRATHWKGGGVTFGPKPRSYAQKMNRKMRRLALRSALSVKAADEQIIVLDQLSMDAPRTREMRNMLASLRVGGSSALFLLPQRNENVELSARNLQQVKTVNAQMLSIRDLLGYDYIVMPRESVEQIVGFLRTDQ